MKLFKKDHWIRTILILSGGVLALVGIGLLAVYVPPSFLRVGEVAILTTQRHLSDLDLIRLSEVKKGDNLLTLRLGRVRANLLRYPWVKEVRLSKQFPSRLLIWMEEHEAVALFDHEAGEKGFYLIDREGQPFKKAEKGDPVDLPTITGLRDETRFLLKPVVEILAAFEASEPLRRAGVSEVHWDVAKGLSLFTKEPCVRLEMGEGGWMDKIERATEVWETIRATARRPKVLDLNYQRKVVVRQGN